LAILLICALRARQSFPMIMSVPGLSREGGRIVPRRGIRSGNSGRRSSPSRWSENGARRDVGGKNAWFQGSGGQPGARSRRRALPNRDPVEQRPIGEDGRDGELEAGHIDLREVVNRSRERGEVAPAARAQPPP